MPFTPEQAREAARKSAQVRAEKRERQRLLNELGSAGEREGSNEGAAPAGMAGSPVRSSATDDRVALIRVPVEIGAVIRKLQHDAKAGDTAAARELRAWLSQFPPDDAAADASDLAAPQRSRIAAILARALAEDEEHLQAEGFQAGTQDGFDSALAAPATQPVAATPADDEPLASGAPEAPSSDTQGPRTPSDDDGSHTADGTAPPSQMTVDDCIAEAVRDEHQE